LVGASCARAVS